MRDEMKVVVQGYQVIERKVSRNGTTGRIYLPRAWVNRKVKIVLMQPAEEEGEDEKTQ